MPSMPNAKGAPRRIADALRLHPRLYWVARRTYTAVNSVLPPVVVENVPGSVHRNDLMMNRASQDARAWYLEGALAAVALIREALEDAGADLAAADVLDFGCSHGRIVRHLVRQARTVSACDLDHEAVRFCAREFGAVPVFGDADITHVSLEDYDAVWMGSVVTHHPATTCAQLLEVLASRVRPGGVLVLTTTDAITLGYYLRSPQYAWLIGYEAQILADLDATGAAYVPYPQNGPGGYGLGFQAEGWVHDVLAPLGLVHLWSRSEAWGQQAVHAWCRPAAQPPSTDQARLRAR